MTMSQCQGTLASFKVLKEEGTQIPEEVLAKLEDDKAGFLSDTHALDLDNLGADVLHPTPPHTDLAGDVPPEIPDGINQHGTNEQQVPPEDSTVLRERGNDEA